MTTSYAVVRRRKGSKAPHVANCAFALALFLQRDFVRRIFFDIWVRLVAVRETQLLEESQKKTKKATILYTRAKTKL